MFSYMGGPRLSYRNHSRITPFAQVLLGGLNGKDADDPLFRPVDADDFRVNGNNASDFSNLVENGLVRVTMPLPANVKLIDPATGQPSNETTVDLWRAVMPVLNVAISGPDGVAPTWPPEYGGLGVDATVARAIETVLAPYHLGRLNPLGLNLCAPALFAHGTDAQRRRFLPPIVRNAEF